MKPYTFLTQLKRQIRNRLRRMYGAVSSYLRTQITQQRRGSNDRRRLPHSDRASQPFGFVLPTAIMLLLVMSLVVGGILIRTFNRTQQAITQRESVEIYNDATPAIDRAKAKLEYLFQKDPRLPAGVPSEKLLTSIMLDDSDVDVPEGEEPPPDDVYTFPGEDRLEMAGHGDDVNAWAFGVDNDGDGEPDDENGNGRPDTIVAYSIIWNTPGSDTQALKDQTDTALKTRAQDFQVRQGPQSSEPTEGCEDEGKVSRIESGWLRDPVSTSILRKNFQITAVAIPDTEFGTLATLELQQERLADRGNKWAAWFRNDLEIFPGLTFKWNGAVHTEGNLIIGSIPDRDAFQGYLVSGYGSCLYKAGKSTSENTINVLKEGEKEGEKEIFRGHMIVGRVTNDQESGAPKFHLWLNEKEAKFTPEEDVTITPENDSVASLKISDALLDPVLLFTKDETKNRGSKPGPDEGWNDREFVTEGRILNQSSKRPYIDDFYRADDRFGPNPGYAGKKNLLLTSQNVKTGDPIGGDNIDELTQNKAKEDEDPLSLGLDGYWERRAWREGMRTIVGQRLELGGNPLSTVPDLKTIDENHLTPDLPHQSLQRRSLRDSLAAVQTTAIYHSDDPRSAGSEEQTPPYAAIVSTVHPGTGETLKRSSIFEMPLEPLPMKSDLGVWFGPTFGDASEELAIDFLTGRGTNGWELNLKEGFFEAPEVNEALARLANFAGDPDGAFPATQDDMQHPYPSLTQWGDFSNLRRSMTDDLDSFADNTNKHTAAITLGTLANQLAFLDGIDYKQIAPLTTDNLLLKLDAALETLDNRICELDNYSATSGAIKADLFTDDGVCQADNNGLKDGEVIYYPNEDLNHNDVVDPEEDFDGNGKLLPAVPTMVIYAPTSKKDDYEAIARVPPAPDAYLAALEARVNEIGINATEKTDRKTIAQFARFVMEKEQVDRDRHFGFRSSRFGFDAVSDTTTIADKTIDITKQTPIGQYQYYVKYLLDEDYNGNLKFDSDTAGAGDAEVREEGHYDASGDPDRLGEVEVTGSNLQVEDWAGNDDGEIDFGEDFDRDGIQDLFFSEDLNGDGKLSIISITGLDGERHEINEDWNNNDRLDEFTKPEDGGNSDNYEVNSPVTKTPFPRYGFTPRSEDLNGDGEFNSAINEADLKAPLPPELYDSKTFWDLNGNGTPDPDVSDFNEDINGNGKFDIFRHRGATYYPGVVLHVGCDFSDPNEPGAPVDKQTGNNYFGFGKPTNAKEEARFIRLASSLCSTEAKYPALHYLFPKYEHEYLASSVDLNGDDIVSNLDEQPLFALTEDLNKNGRLDPGEDGYDLRNPTKILNVRKNKDLDGEPLSYTSDENYNEEAKTEESYVSQVNTASYEAVDLAVLEQIALKPKPIASWVLPYVDRGDDPGADCNNDATEDKPNPNCSKYNLIYADMAETSGDSDAYYRVAFKDTAFFDGREQLVTRALNLDVEMLSDNADESLANGTIEGNTWLTGGNSDVKVPEETKDGGIVFAFREDAMREDGIARPAGGACTEFSDGGCSDQNALTPQDPAVDPENGISAKAVNFIPDPARRTHGFRVINGIDVSRPKQGGEAYYGLTFVSDNPTYVQGDFNCHKELGDDSCDDPIEEFNYTLADKGDWGPTDFYDRRSRTSDQDERFANPEQDSWRYSEFLVDAYTVLSDNFCDGSIEDGFIQLPTGDLRQGLRNLKRSLQGTVQQVYGCANSGINATSFLGQSLPESTSSDGVSISSTIWKREDPADLTSPIQISPNGQPMFLGVDESEYNAAYQSFTTRNAISYKERVVIPPTDKQTQNAVIIAGLIPSRQFQSYGGLHNFPRFLEYRDKKVINISGSFMNLKFSSQATAPYDQKAWEAGEEPVSSNAEILPYYRAPIRNWGYDVALQLTRPGPVSSRLTTVSGARSEFYRELPAGDPYVLNLRCASFDGSPVDENASLSGNCP